MQSQDLVTGVAVPVSLKFNDPNRQDYNPYTNVMV